MEKKLVLNQETVRSLTKTSGETPEISIGTCLPCAGTHMPCLETK
jgi:hypothetical protein